MLEKKKEVEIKLINLSSSIAPVTLEKIGEGYKVKSGKHRMAVTRRLGLTISVFILPAGRARKRILKERRER